MKKGGYQTLPKTSPGNLNLQYEMDDGAKIRKIHLNCNKMKLINKELELKFGKYPIYSQDGKNIKTVIVKYFTPWGGWTWYITEAEKQGDDWLLFGYVVSGLGEDCNEWGYISLNELQSIKGPFGLGVEIDLYFGNHKINMKGEIL